MEFVIVTIAAAVGFCIGVAAGRGNNEVKVPPGEPPLLIKEQQEIVEIKAEEKFSKREEELYGWQFKYSKLCDAKRVLMDQVMDYVEHYSYFDPVDLQMHYKFRLRVVKGDKQ